MRHAKKRHQLNRFTSWHKATMVSMARNLITYQSIKTTPQRAKAVRPLVERLIGMAKENTLAAKRRAFAVLCDHKMVKFLFEDIGPRFANRQGGYIRILHLGRRRGDNAEMAIMELTEIKKKEPKKPKKGAKAQEKPVEDEAAQKHAHSKDEGAAKDEKRPSAKKPAKKFLGGFKNIFKKERDAL